jgi:propionyl-CoA synthetase
MEEVLAGHPDVAECAVVGVADEIKGEVPVGFVVIKAGVDRPEADLVRELVERVRESIGPVAAFRVALVVARLPKTRSGKILRGAMKKLAEGGDPGTPATIDDPAILPEIAGALRRVGYPRSG